METGDANIFKWQQNYWPEEKYYRKEKEKYPAFAQFPHPLRPQNFRWLQSRRPYSIDNCVSENVSRIVNFSKAGQTNN